LITSAALVRAVGSDEGSPVFRRVKALKDFSLCGSSLYVSESCYSLAYMQRAWNSPRAGPLVWRTFLHKGQRPRSHFWLGHLPGSTNSTPQPLHFTVYWSSRMERQLMRDPPRSGIRTAPAASGAGR